jgi:hypothetical protein
MRYFDRRESVEEVEGEDKEEGWCGGRGGHGVWLLLELPDAP